MKKLQNPCGKNYERTHVETAFCGGYDRFHKIYGIRFVNPARKLLFVCFIGKESDKNRYCKGRNKLSCKKKKTGFYIAENGDSNGTYKKRRPGIDAVAKHF